MALWFNLVLAWVSVALAVLLIIIWALRIINKKKKIPWIKKLNCTLRRHHKIIGILLVVTSVVHGILSSDVLLSFNWGTAIAIVAILLGLSWLLRKKLQLKKWWMYIHRSLTAVFVAILVVHVVNVGGILIDDLIAGRLSVPSTDTIAIIDSSAYTAHAADDPEEAIEETPLPDLPKGNGNGNGYGNHNSNNASSDSPAMTTPSATQDPSGALPDTSASDTASSAYTDGVYTGTGTGYRPGLVVEVVIENGMITSVTVTDHNEKNELFWGVPVEQIPQLIVESQSTDVDTVSGATMTSRGIIEAVNDALAQAAN